MVEDKFGLPNVRFPLCVSPPRILAERKTYFQTRCLVNTWHVVLSNDERRLSPPSDVELSTVLNLDE